MKKFTLLLASIAMSSVLLAQNFKVTDSQGNDITNSKHTISGATALVDEPFGFQNLRLDSAEIILKRTEVITISGTEDYFCWGDCFAAQPVGTYPVWVADESITIGPNDVESSTHVYFVPNKISGKSTFLYVFYDVNDPKDSVYVEVEFDIPAYVGIAEKPSLSAEVIATPNPANDNVKIRYNLENTLPNQASLIIVDVLGKEKAEFRLTNSSGSINVNTSEFNSGIYFYTIRTANEVLATKKLIIN